MPNARVPQGPRGEIFKAALEERGVRSSEERAESAVRGPPASAPPGCHIAIGPRGRPHREPRLRSPAHRNARCSPSSCRSQRTGRAMGRSPAETARRPERPRVRRKSAQPARSRMRQAQRARAPRVPPAGQSHRRQDRRQASARIGSFLTGAWPRPHLCALITIRADTTQMRRRSRALRRRPHRKRPAAAPGRELPEDRHPAVKLDSHRRAIACAEESKYVGRRAGICRHKSGGLRRNHD